MLDNADALVRLPHFVSPSNTAGSPACQIHSISSSNTTDSAAHQISILTLDLGMEMDKMMEKGAF